MISRTIKRWFSSLLVFCALSLLSACGASATQGGASSQVRSSTSQPPTVQYPTCLLGAPVKHCERPDLVAIFRNDITQRQMEVFAQSLMFNKSEITALAGTSITPDYRHRALLVSWGKGASRSARLGFESRLRRSHMFAHIGP